MDVLLFVDVFQGLRHLPHQLHAMAFQAGIAIVEQLVEPRALDELHHDVLQPVIGHPVLVGFHDQRVMKRGRDFSLGGLLQPFETGLKRRPFLAVGDFQADDLVRLAVPRHVELGHGPRDGLAQNLEPLAHVDAVALEHGLKSIEQAHGSNLGAGSRLGNILGAGSWAYLPQ